MAAAGGGRGGLTRVDAPFASSGDSEAGAPAVLTLISKLSVGTYVREDPPTLLILNTTVSSQALSESEIEPEIRTFDT